uniref:Reverse transcriptase n=1 Tax=Cannabis sativa TaxID=3483 RepID=A0A803NHR9_CANSA
MFDLVPLMFSPKMHDLLLMSFTNEDVKAALFQMNPYKSLRIDGTEVGFYQKFWHEIEIEVCHAVLDFLKVMTKRLHSVLGSIIFEEQSTFIPGPLIIDNAMIGFECLNLIKRHKKGKKGFLALKVDMAKAY